MDTLKIDFKLIQTQEQIDKLSSLAFEIWREHFPKIIGGAQTEYMLIKFLSPSAIRENIANNMQFFAYVEPQNPEEYLGFCAILPDNTGLYLSKFYVKKEFRGKRLSSQAIDFLKAICKENNYPRLYLSCNKNNLNTIEIYQHFGFKNIKSVKEEIGDGFYFDDYVFEMKID